MAKQLAELNVNLAYEDILVQAVLVLWLAVPISMKLGCRLFPEWQSSGLDPNSVTDIDPVLEIFGFNTDDCIWDRMVQPWTQSVHLAYGSHSPAGSRRTVGYLAAYMLWCCTIILGVSLVGGLLVNRHRPISSMSADVG
ncbi:uncharacterized protein LOC129592925 [Paramacrobiotus metropolitanus]|uniref:uncharacterized protein LOC129592925 n=1 Tax=Paramacrobiotus metropolitanus TaxID=2943436 RepID=UPI002445AF12|nr:uncharacterized protein LOC129592925 [Paramacrobiotus metropolitanus]